MATGLYAIKCGSINIGDNVLIIGTGPIGLGAVPFAVLSGAKKVMLAGRKDFKLELGKKFRCRRIPSTPPKRIYIRASWN